MLRFLLVPVGLILVGLVLVDLLWTTLGASAGAGPVTAHTSALAWRAVRGPGRRARSRVGRATGVIVVFVVLFSWIALLYVGWLLVFGAADRAVVSTATERPAGLAGRSYFVGYTVFTLGNGDLKPGASLWQTATVTATGTGLVLISLAITYLVPVVGAATDRRSLAGYIASLGESPAEIVRRSWDGSDVRALAPHLEALAPRIQEAGERHLTYPVLHFFSTSDPRTSAPVAIAVLHEALSLLRSGIVPEVRLQPITVEPAWEAIGSFLDTLAGAFISPADDPLPPPDLATLRAEGLPTVEERAFLANLEDQRKRRCLVAGLLSEGGWGAATFVPRDQETGRTAQGGFARKTEPARRPTGGEGLA